MFSLSRLLFRGSPGVTGSFCRCLPHSRLLTSAVASKQAKGGISEEKASVQTVTILQTKHESDGVVSEPEHPPSIRIFISNIPATATVEDLRKALGENDKLLDIHLYAARGLAHATFTDVSAATEALRTLKDKEVLGRPLRVTYTSTLAPHTRLRLEQVNAERSQSSTLFITNLSPNITREELIATFSKYGKVVDVKMRKPTGGQTISLAQVTFENAASSEAALKSEQGELLKGHIMLIMYNRGKLFGGKRWKGGPTRRLFLARLWRDTTEEELRSALEGVTGVTNIALKPGFAHITFENVIYAVAAYDMLSKNRVLGRKVLVDYTDDTDKALEEALVGTPSC